MLAPAAASARSRAAGADGPLSLAAHGSLALAQRGARWACPTGRCEALVLARPRRVADGWQSAGRAATLLQGSGALGGFDPKDLQSAYSIPTSLGAPQTVAVIDAFGYPDAESDLASYRERYDLPACTKANGCLKKVNGAGTEGSYPATEEGWDEEAALDVDMVSAACSQCHILMVEAANESVEALAQADAVAARLGANEVSNSWGEAESECGKACAAHEADFEHAGVLTTAAAGDEGYEDLYANSEKEPLSPEFPADLPGVVAVGGTALFKDSAVSRGWRETVWNEPEYELEGAEGIGTGSGCSAFLKIAKPSWQSDAGCAYRTDDDVAAVAATETPLSVRIDGRWELFGGTSASTPLIAAIEAHASAYVRSLGPRAFYEDPSSLYDVLEGFNYLPGPSPCAPEEYLCNAQVGYDAPTGLGSPDGVPVLPEAAPEASISEAGELTATTARLHGAVNPRGATVGECKFEYGTSTKYGKTAACGPAPGSGTSAVAVSAALSGLKAGSTYDVRLFAQSTAGADRSVNESFKMPLLPTAATAAASELSAGSARLQGKVNPEGLPLLECAFEYGTSTKYGSSVPCASRPEGSLALPVSAPISSLKSSTSYDFRLLVRTSAGAAKSSNRMLKTLK